MVPTNLMTRTSNGLVHAPILVRVAAVLAFVALLSSASEIHAAEIFSDGFESGDASAWSHSIEEKASYPSTECRSGKFCGAMTHPAGVCDQPVMWVKRMAHDLDQVYVRAWFKFPVGFSFTNNTSSCTQATEHKAIIIETNNNVGRCMLRFFGGSGDSSPIRFACSGKKTLHGIGTIKADGRWHSLEMQLKRRPTGYLEVWLDGNKIADQPYDVCGSERCGAINSIKFGAYINYPWTKKQTFFLDDIQVATQRGSASDTPQPAKPAPPVLLDVR